MSLLNRPMTRPFPIRLVWVGAEVATILGRTHPASQRLSDRPVPALTMELAEQSQRFAIPRFDGSAPGSADRHSQFAGPSEKIRGGAGHRGSAMRRQREL